MSKQVKRFTDNIEIEWWVTPSEQNNVSILHIKVKIRERQIELAREAPSEGFEDMNDQEVESFVLIELFNRFYPRER